MATMLRPAWRSPSRRNDARDIAATLLGLGFATDEVVDAVCRAREADAALFVYAGHGLQRK